MKNKPTNREIENSDSGNSSLVNVLQRISQIKDPIEKELLIIQLSKETEFSAPDYRLLLQAYSEKKKAEWKNTRIFIFFGSLDEVFENINYWLERWDFLKFLDYASKITIIIGLIGFISQLSKAEERAELERRKTHYEAWQVINTSVGQSGSGGRIDALQTLTTEKVTLSGVNLEGANLQAIDLKGANLRNANLKRVNLEGADLSHTDLAGAELQDANLDETNFYKANLRGANLDGAKNILTAKFEGAFYDEATELETAGLLAISGAIGLKSLSGQNLKNESRLQGASLEGLDFSNAILTGVDLKSANLSNVNFEGANLENTDFSDANISAVRFQKANLAGSTIEEATVDSFYIYDNETIFPEGFNSDKGINLDDFIVGLGGTFTWRMALRDGERVPDSLTVVQNIKDTAAQLEMMQKRLEVTLQVTSWYRPLEVNRALGGAKSSAHLEGKAVDVYISGKDYSCDKLADIFEEWPGRLGCSSGFFPFLNLDILQPFPDRKSVV